MSFPAPIGLASSGPFSSFDLSIVVSDQSSSEVFSELSNVMDEQHALDPRVGDKVSLLLDSSFPGGRLLHIPTGKLTRDYDDVRRIFDLGRQHADLLIELKSTKPVVSVELNNLPDHKKDLFAKALGVFYLGLCQGLYQPLEARQSLGEDSLEPVQQIALIGADEVLIKQLIATEAGKRVARDLCGTEPERMAPPGFADYCQALFSHTDVDITIIDDEKQLFDQYPALHAVARASLHVQRHQPRVIQLTYTGQGEISETLMLAGKGITFDTGGVDLKVNGHMAGMSRDKGGAAAVAGFMYALALLKPKGIKVMAEIAAVRNNVDAEAYTPDEIITGHSGVRVRVGNTDAEGRLVMMDILSHFREQAANEINPSVFSFATLTGHAMLAHGPYTAVLENGPALASGVNEKLCSQGLLWGDMCHQSLVHREDYEFVQPRTKADDVLSSNNAPSVSTVRGHQFPMAFLAIASGLDKHGLDSPAPIPFTHVDIAGSGVENMSWQHGKPTAAPVTSLLASYIFGNS
ncbi:M17 family metallopeptidase [Glaciecola sp. 1036]|uniref:M17 family metallopeptidase n=1 Tax=Alteromonadaceae TaxID=72275 RepID=UPI003CFDBF01